LILTDLSDRIQGFISCLAVIHYADRRADLDSISAAVCWCHSILSECSGKSFAVDNYRRLAELGRSCLQTYAS
jgi:hypothetical protein